MKFINCLSENVNFDLGYRIYSTRYDVPTDDTNCHCPISKYSRRWRDISILSTEYCYVCTDKTFFPSSLKQHSQLLAHKCVYHHAVFTYLYHLYHCWWQHDVLHSPTEGVQHQAQQQIIVMSLKLQCCCSINMDQHLLS